MKTQPTFDDANLIIKLYELRREPRLRDARKFIGGMKPFNSREDFLKTCPPGTEENASFRMVVTYWEMACSFVANGILDKELFFRANNLELLFVWEKIRMAIPEIREVSKNPLQYAYVEQVSNDFIAYMNEHAPQWYETFAGGMRK